MSAIDFSSLADALTLRAGHNTNVVLCGTLALGLAGGVIGSLLLLRKRSLLADALSHAALPGVCAGFLVATALGLPGKSLAILLPSAAVFGLLGIACVQALTSLPRVKEDAAIGVVLSVFFAGGVVMLVAIQQMPTGNRAGLNHFIFGQAATMNTGDAALIAIASVGVLAVAALLYKELRLLCFDSPFARSIGRSTLALDALLLIMVLTVTVIGLKAVGAILMVALLIIPPAAARFWTNRLVIMILLAAAIGAVGCFVGGAFSAATRNLPTGPAIVVVCGLLFIVSMLAAPRRGLVAAGLRRVRLKRIIGRDHLLRAMYESQELGTGGVGGVTVAQLLQRRRWSSGRITHLLRRAVRQGHVRASGGGFELTSAGREAAAGAVRQHRLWEIYLTTEADVAPSHVDRDADDIEHVLGEDLVRRLESQLRDRLPSVRDDGLPLSPHALSPAGAAPPNATGEQSR